MPLGEQLIQSLLALARDAVKTLLSLFFLAPFAGQQALAFQPSQQWIQRAFIDGEAMLSQRLTQRVTVLLVAQRCHDRHHQEPAAEFEA